MQRMGTRGNGYQLDSGLTPAGMTALLVFANWLFALFFFIAHRVGSYGFRGIFNPRSYQKQGIRLLP